MAKKKAEPTVEEQVQDIQDESLEEFLGEPVEGGKVVEQEEEPAPKVEEPKKETPPVEDKGVDFDPDKFGEELSNKTAEKIIDKIVPKTPPSDVDEELMSPWAKEGRTPVDYEEITDWAIKKSEIINRRAWEARQKQEEELTKQQEEAQKARLNDYNKMVDEDLDDLYSRGKLPRIVKQDDPNDEGVVSRKALFQTMLEVNQKRVAEGKRPIASVKEIYYEHYKAPTREPAGADAPVSMGRHASSDDDKELDYRDIHTKRSFVDILMGK